MQPDTTLPNHPEGSYKVYSGTIISNGTLAPTVIVLNNTLGATVSWTWESTGVIAGTSVGAFTENKIWTEIQQSAGYLTRTYLSRQSNDAMTIITTISGVNDNDVMEEPTSFEIRVYN